MYKSYDLRGERESTNIGIERILSVLSLASFANMVEQNQSFHVGGSEFHLGRAKRKENFLRVLS